MISSRERVACVSISRMLALMLSLCAGAATAASPSFDCAKATGDVQQLICKDDALSELDRKVADVYAQAEKHAGKQLPALKAEQSGWIQGLDECWKADEMRKCVMGEYVNRVAELQAKYRMAKSRGPVTFKCPKTESGGDIRVTFYETDPLSLIAKRGSTESFMTVVHSLSGTKYRGRNESFWDKGGGEALVLWGFDKPKIHCTAAKP